MPTSVHRRSPSVELTFGGEQRAGDVAGRRPGTVRHPERHDLPDRVEDIGIRTGIEDGTEENGGEVGLTDAGR